MKARCPRALRWVLGGRVIRLLRSNQKEAVKVSHLKLQATLEPNKCAPLESSALQRLLFKYLILGTCSRITETL